ncbi:MAG: serine protease [Planctomycetota bacterium]
MNATKNNLLAAAVMTALSLLGSAASADSNIYENLLDSSVWIVNETEGSRGSGVVVDAERRLVVTNYHVVGEASHTDVYFSAYDEDSRLVTDRATYRSNHNTLRQMGMAARGKVVGTWKKRDLALIQLDTLPEDVRGVKLADSPVKPGEAIHSIGNPGLSDSLWVYSPGRVRQVHQKAWSFSDGQEVDSRVIQTSSPINPGDSGGPVVNSAGELVGVMSASSTTARLMTYAIEASEIRELLDWYNKEHPDAGAPQLASSGY